MSLAIDVDHVSEVLLSDGEWHRVAEGSFELDSYEYVRAADGPNAAPRLGGGQEKLVPATGARWTERGDTSGNQRAMFCEQRMEALARYDADQGDAKATQLFRLSGDRLEL